MYCFLFFLVVVVVLYFCKFANLIGPLVVFYWPMVTDGKCYAKLVKSVIVLPCINDGEQQQATPR